MAIVIDASVAVPWLIRSDFSAGAMRVFETNEDLIAPDLILAEITNAIWRLTNFGSVPAIIARNALSQAPKYFAELVSSAELQDRALDLAIDLQHPAYDGFYLALAELRNAKLVTADRCFARRCATTSLSHLITSI